jgi:hypothetical protein
METLINSVNPPACSVVVPDDSEIVRAGRNAPCSLPESLMPKEKQLVAALRRAIESDPRTVNAIAVEAGLSASVVWRFVQTERSLSLEAAAALAETLRLQLVPLRGRGGGRPAPGRPRTPSR